MSCHKILQQICDDLSEDINSDVCDHIRRHLNSCPQCTEQLTSMRAVVQLYRCLGEREVPSSIHQRLVTLLNVTENKA